MLPSYTASYLLNTFISSVNVVQIESLESANRNYAEELSILAHTCNQLTEELQSDREQLEAMEARYDQLNDEVHII